jgi:NTE family protein
MQYDSLYLTSGGTHGYSMLGVIFVLEKFNLINNLKKFIGTSVGSLISLLVVLKYSALDIYKIFISQNIEEIYFNTYFNKNNIILNLINNLGIDNGDGINRILELFLKEKNLDINITFKELYDFNNIELIIVASNITHNKLQYFSYKLTPDCNVLLAIKASCAIPLIFNPIIYENNILIDGGVLDGNPNKFVNNKTLTIRLITDKNTDINISNINLLQYVKVLFDLMVKFEHNDNKFHTITFVFKTRGINFDISNTDKKTMFNYGICETLKFVKYKRHLRYYFDIWNSIT